MVRKKYSQIIIMSAIIFISSTGMAFSVDDGFVAAKKIPGKHFTVLYESGVDVPALLEQLNIGPSDRLLAGKPTETKFSTEEELIEMLDTLFIRVCNILDMRLYNDFKGQIKICKNDDELRRVYFNFFSKELNSNFPFYIHHFNTIYVSAENFTSAAMGHEIAHAVISHLSSPLSMNFYDKHILF
ncbi:unnamed protein product [marine sediment metagenome]|uniref:Uncharacterized protein n=1 Tax=marine sediment metagenome TaxID=412755 RepID=X0YR59_9ZZZZ